MDQDQPVVRQTVTQGVDCATCRFPIEADDVWLVLTDGRAICLHCYGYQTDTLPRVSKVVRADINHAEDSLKTTTFGTENPWEYGIPGAP